MSKANNNIAKGENFSKLALQSAPAFDAIDLATLRDDDGAPQFLSDATRALVSMTSETPRHPTKENPAFGRYQFGDFGETALEITAMFRLCRAALDFLEADFKACARREATFYRAQVATFERVSE